MKKKQHTTAFYLETLLMILVFVAIILVLTRVFALGRNQSAKAETLTNAVTLAANAAEAVSASRTPEELAERLGESARVGGQGVIAGYRADMSPDTSYLPGEASPLQLDITWEPSKEDRRFVNSTITVYASGSEHPVYVLETAVFVKEVGQ